MNIKNLFRVPLFLAIAATSLSGSRALAQNFTNLHNFTAGNDGALPDAPLILSGSNLYGTTFEAGSGRHGFAVGGGTVFQISTNGASFNALEGFTPVISGTNQYGSASQAGVVLAGNTLFGTASQGGISNLGTVFAVNTDGSGITNLHSFLGSTQNDGAQPEAGLILSGTNLYGITQTGGAFNDGALFKGGTNGAGFTVIYSFTGGNDGASPVAGLILSGTNFYGTARSGGSSAAGTVFSVGTNGGGFATMHAFGSATDGGGPVGGLVLSGGTLYGVTATGGAGGNGTIFMVNTNTSGFAVLHAFTPMNNGGVNSDGAAPLAGLILSGNTLYGTASLGGSGGNGVIFSLTTNGTQFAVLHNFAALDANFTNGDGAMPNASLVLAGSTLYGTASSGGTSDYGAVFSLTLLQPLLAISRSGTNVILSWTNPAPGYVLQSTTNLVPASWSNGSSPVLVGGRNTVTNAAAGTDTFYRLSQ